MVNQQLRLHTGVHVEFFDGGALVLDADGATVHRVAEPGAAVLRLVIDGAGPADLPERLTPALSELVDLDVVEAPAGWSRRHVLRTGAAAGAALASSAVLGSFALPAAADAGSPSDTTVPTPEPGRYSSSTPGTQSVTIPAGAVVTFRLVGGGGGGGSWNGGNGGSGLVLEGTIPAAGAPYTIQATVAGGGKAAVANDFYRGGAGGTGHYAGGAGGGDGGGDGGTLSGNGGGGGGGASALVGPGLLVVAPGGGGGAGGTDDNWGGEGGNPGTGTPPDGGGDGGWGAGWYYGGSGFGATTTAGGAAGAGSGNGGTGLPGQAGGTQGPGGAGGRGAVRSSGSGGGGGGGANSGGGGGGGDTIPTGSGRSLAGGGGGGAGSSAAVGASITSVDLADPSGARDTVGTAAGHRGQGDNGAKNTSKQGPGGDGHVLLTW